jgi:oligoribonuclease (3'-5' exoribonuclease)
LKGNTQANASHLLHHHNNDLSTFKKQPKHSALADVHESIDELVHYREHFLK